MVDLEGCGRLVQGRSGVMGDGGNGLQGLG